jgi:hypothetical protein
MSPDVSSALPLTTPLPISVIPGVREGGFGVEKQSVVVTRLITASAVASTRSMNSSFQGLDRESNHLQLTESDATYEQFVN